MKHGVRLAAVLLLLSVVLAFVPIRIEAVPSYATVSTNKIYYAVNESVVFTLTSNGSRNNLWLYRVDGTWENHYVDVGTSCTLAFGWEGTYEALLETWDNYGSFQSNRIIFHVGTPTTITTAPTYATVNIPKESFLVGESITFSLSTNGNVNSLWIYAPGADGQPSTTGKEYDKLGNTKTLSFSQPGKYAALVEAWNGVGSLQSQKIYFTIVDPNATTKPTTVPTTVTTTKPTTVPTTVTTTKPTTVTTTTVITTKPVPSTTPEPTTVTTTNPTTALPTTTSVRPTAPTVTTSGTPIVEPTLGSTTVSTLQTSSVSTTASIQSAPTTVTKPSVTRPTPVEDDTQDAKKENSDLWPWFWVILILLICIVIVGILLIIKYRDKTDK